MLAHRKAIQRGALPEIEILRAMAEPKIGSLDILRPDLDPRLRAAVAAMIEPAPEKRTITAGEVCRTLRDVVQPGAGRGELHELLNVAKEREKAKKKPSGHEPVAEPVASPAPPAAKAASVPPKAAEVRAKALDHVPAMLRTEPPPKPTEGDTDADATNELDVDKLFDGLALPDESSPLLEILESGPSTVPDDKSTAPTSPPPKAASTKPPPPLPAGAEAPTTQPRERLEERQLSKSAGVAGGVTVLWPRIIPREIVDENRDLAAALQQRMKTIIEKHLPGRPIDYRPEPERVCPKTGCAGVSVGLLLSRSGQGCLVLALISRPGASPTRIVPWVGKVTLRADTVGFREWPESQITVADYIPCNSLLTTMDAQEAAVGEALKAAAQ